MNKIKNKIANIDVSNPICCLLKIISRNSSITSVAINHKFYVITLWMHYMLLTIVFRRKKIIVIVN